MPDMLTFLGWIVGGFGLAIGVWLFVAFLDWLGDLGQEITEEQARRQLDPALRAKRKRRSDLTWNAIGIVLFVLVMLIVVKLRR